MEQLKKYWYFILIAVLLVFGWGFYTWLSARLYIPVTPAQASPQPYVVPTIKTSLYPLARYQPLMNGRLFFEAPAPVLIQFKTNLVLWGVIKGVETRAVVSLAANPERTWVVKAGEAVEGETIVAIGDNYITVRNQTGEGGVMLTN